MHGALCSSLKATRCTLPEVVTWIIAAGRISLNGQEARFITGDDALHADVVTYELTPHGCRLIDRHKHGMHLLNENIYSNVFTQLVLC
ncbi:hypothetical protein EYF80_059110 [Liparis tanakae]|uniref:Uncharacterized protein n=1 Tax=Liparis tanakae TaxID=230148 RepID=A0A4Z2EPM1_9TELE|nr:hypothetical protein EYF80_059110 [Liparis tanakae]